MTAPPSITQLGAICALLIVLAGCGFNGKLDEPARQGERPAAIESMYVEYRKEFLDIGEITAEELLELQGAEDLVLVDVREPKERAVSIIPGSISKEEFESNKDAYLDKRIVVHCTIGYRSGIYTKGLAAEGIEARNLVGSILSWTHAGGEVVTLDGAKTNRVHVYGSQWDLLAEGFEAVW